METNQIILRQDRLGRVQRTVEQRTAIVEEFRRSGLSAAQFERLSGIGYNTLWTWLKESGMKLRKPPAKQPRLVRAVLSSPSLPAASAPSPLCIRFGQDVMVEITDAAQVPVLAALIKALAPTTPC